MASVTHIAGDDQSIATRAWLIVLLLFFVQMTNFVDKTVVSLAAGHIMEEFNLSTEEYGIIGGAFFSLYAVSGLLVAFFITPRYRPRKIIAVMLLIWSLVQLPIVFAASFPILILCRALLGMGEGAATPTALNATHEWFPNKARNMPSALVMFGTTVGSMVAAPILTATIQMYGWRSAFLACAILGATVFCLWLLLSRDGPYGAAPMETAGASPGAADATPEETALTSGKALWLEPTLLGATVAGTACYWLAGFQVSWLAPYLTELTQDLTRAGWLLSLIFAFQASCTLGVSFVSQRMLRRGFSSRVARSFTIGVSMAVTGLAFIAAELVSGETGKIILIAIAVGMQGPVFPLCAAIISEVTPLGQRNKAMTIILSIVTLAAFPSSILIGVLVGAPGLGWFAALAMNGAVAIFGACFCFFMINPERSLARRAALAEEMSA